jgi:SAM-dependent methyltransferase
VEWWRSLFNSPIYFELYAAEDTKKAVAEVRDLIRLLDLRPPARILDIPCGYGRHALELARRGFTVTGVDVSPVQLGRARQEAARAGVAVTFVEQDARTLALEGGFDLAINMFLSFGYFETEAEDLAMLRGISRALRPAGRLLMQLWNREYEIRYFDRYQVDRRGEILEVEEWEFDHLRGRLNWTNTAFFPDGRRQSWWHSIRAYTVVELRALLERAGLRLDAVYGGLGGEPYSIESEEMVLLATRP